MSENETPKTHRRPVVMASTVLVGGIIVSLWFNLKAISLEPNAGPGAYVSGILWPVFLLVSIELLIHTPWRKGWADTATKGGVLILVAGVAAWISYWHGVHVLDFWGYDEIGKRVGPVVPDAAMALATLALQRVGQARRLATTEDVAMATQAPVATGQPATVMDVLDARGQAAINRMMAEAKATDPLAMPTLDEDWGGLEDEVAAWVAEAQTAPTAPAAPSAAQDETEAGTEDAPVKLTKVPAAAAMMIRDLLAAKTAPADLDGKVAAEHGTSPRTARRWRGAVVNGSAVLVS